ncbi:hypothetical protein QJS10_CPA03g00608 [Acorus calamus]|uniref:CCHC-type domain-containing protein n=1 Tax=Acorus calamus TaxID=4465 RepID=A0AAV9F4S4_ACOCL|nr:hypothetical protein QJS10_CPA03g00608 [Acorus calamus]
MISNAQTDEEYADEKTLIPKNMSVLVRRVPGHPQKPIIIAPPERKVEEKIDIVAPSINSLPDNSSFTRFPPEESKLDEFGDDLYSVPEIYPVQPVNRVQDAILSDMADEDSKIKALVDTRALDWQRKTQDGYGSGRGFDRGIGGRMSGGRGFGRGLEHNTPPHGYICYRCNIPGHFIQHCPTNGDPNYDMKRVKPPTGITKSMLMETPDGSLALPSGAVAVLKPNESAFEKEMEGLPTTCPIIDFPQNCDVQYANKR